MTDPADRARVRPGRIAFVPPRFGASVVGGAEAVVREAAIGLAARGWEVEIVTTCAVDHYTWANELPEGPGEEDGLTVWRFPTVKDDCYVAHLANARIVRDETPTMDAQVSWLGAHFRVPGLFHHLVRHGREFDAVIFSPYLFWSTIVGMRAVRDRAIVIPCLHDEHYARLEVMRHVLADPVSVWFMSEPEHELAHRLGPVAEHHSVTGEGFHVPASYDPEGFRERHGITRPFVLFAGRRESGKGWEWLVDAFAAAASLPGMDLDLVTIGVGDVDPPEEIAKGVIDLGFVSERERDNAFAAAAAYVQPSVMESFSRTIMEAWLAGTPVVTRADSEVVAWHCRRSGGGYLLSGPEDLGPVLCSISSDPAAAAAMATRGREYVRTEYSWDAVLDRMEAELAALRPGAGEEALAR